MKTGRTLTELAQEIERQRDSKKDLVASTKVMMMDAEDNSVALRIGHEHMHGIRDTGHDQIGLHTGIPAAYYDRMLASSPHLLANNVNHWLDAAPESKRLVRILDGSVRAFLSDTYRPLENFDLAEAVLPVLLEQNLAIMSCEITDRRLYIKAVDQRIMRDVPTGKKLGEGHTFFDTLSPAIIISNSEIGYGALRVESGVYTRACTNLCLIAEGGLKRRHVGARHDLGGEDIAHLLSDEARKASDRAVFLKVRDVTKAAFEEARFDATVRRIAAAAGATITSPSVEKVVDVTAKTLGFNGAERNSILRHLIEGADLTKYGLSNAITRTAQDIDSYDRATEIERIGGTVIDLPANDWRRIAEAA